MKFDVIVVDCPWAYNKRKNVKKIPGVSWFGGGAPGQYRVLSDRVLQEEVAPLVAAVAATNCALFSWSVFPMIQSGMDFIKACGFRYATTGFVWVKVSKAGRPIAGPGYYTGSNAEPVLLGVRGSMRPHDKLVPQVEFSPRLKPHSRKPEWVQDRIERMYPTARRLEVFATRRRPGWICIGKGVTGRDIRDDLGLLKVVPELGVLPFETILARRDAGIESEPESLEGEVLGGSQGMGGEDLAMLEKEPQLLPLEEQLKQREPESEEVSPKVTNWIGHPILRREALNELTSQAQEMGLYD